MGNQHEREDHRTDLKTLLDSGMQGHAINTCSRA